MQSLAKDVHTRHLFVFFFSAKDGRTRQAEQCITPGIRLFVTPQRLLEDSSCANNEFLLLPLADVVTIRKERKSGSFAALPRIGSSSQTAWNQLEQDDQLSVIVKFFCRSSWEQVKCLCNKL